MAWVEAGAVGRKAEPFRAAASIVRMMVWMVVVRAEWLVVRSGIFGWWVVRWLERWC